MFCAPLSLFDLTKFLKKATFFEEPLNPIFLIKRVFTRTLPTTKYILRVCNRNTRKRCEICLKLVIKTLLYCYLRTYFTPFTSISIVHFDQVNFCRRMFPFWSVHGNIRSWKILSFYVFCVEAATSELFLWTCIIILPIQKFTTW